MKIVILAAGKGSRLGDPAIPKPLTLLYNGQSILEYQLKQLGKSHSLDNVIIVAGYHKEMIMDRFPSFLYIYNPDYASENTSKSLLRALRKIDDDDLLWLNGDVIFHPSIIDKVFRFNRSCMVVNEGPVGEEEVKYRSNKEGRILEVSKTVQDAEGEALGINYLKASDLDLFRRELILSKDQDYFERAIEASIQKGMDVWKMPVDAALCTEIDFPEDLERANQMLRSWKI